MTTSDDARDNFGELLQRHRGIVFKVANSYANDPEDRADLAQVIAAQLWKAWPKYDSRRLVTTWMYRIALNVAISQLRGRRLRDRHQVPLHDDLHDNGTGDREGPDHDLHEIGRASGRERVCQYV